MRDYIQPIAATLLLAAACTAFGAGGGSMHSTPSLTPQEQARVFYNDGVSAIEKADALSADAAHQDDAKKQQKALSKAKSAYTGAMKKFIRATGLDPSMYQAWNYV